MPKLTDPEILTCYQNALRNWRYRGFIVLEQDADVGLRKHLKNYADVAFMEMLHDFVLQANGEIDQVVETREQWRDLWDFHYDLRPVVNGIKMYVETRLAYTDPTDPDDPIIYVVNIHPA